MSGDGDSGRTGALEAVLFDLARVTSLPPAPGNGHTALPLVSRH